MNPIKVVQIGLGPLGLKVMSFIDERQGIEIVGAVDKKQELIGKRVSEISGAPDVSIVVRENLSEVLSEVRPDVAVLTTVSDMHRITPQVEEVVSRGLPVVTTCEELSYPWDQARALAEKIDQAAKTAGVAVLGTGVNPGFLMDALPTMLTSVCQRVDAIEVSRYQDAQYRRIPFQDKIGARLTPSEFEARKKAGTLRHVGLTESMQFIASRMGWKLDKTEDIIEPVMARNDIAVKTGSPVKAGRAMGVRQTGLGYVGDQVRIRLIFQAAVGEPESFDEIVIHGQPDIRSKIEGGVNGDIATCAITINAIPRVLEATPGLRTMQDISLVSFFV